MKTHWKIKGSCCAVLSHSSHVRLCDPTDCSLPGSPAHGIFQARILEWVAVSFSRGSFQPRDEPVSPMSAALAGRFFTTEPLRKPRNHHTHAINCYPALPKKWTDRLIQVGWIQHNQFFEVKRPIKWMDCQNHPPRCWLLCQFSLSLEGISHATYTPCQKDLGFNYPTNLDLLQSKNYKE